MHEVQNVEETQGEGRRGGGRSMERTSGVFSRVHSGSGEMKVEERRYHRRRNIHLKLCPQTPRGDDRYWMAVLDEIPPYF